MIRRTRSLARSAGTWIVAAGPILVLALAVVGAVIIAIGWDTNVWLTLAAILAELGAVVLLATASTHVSEAIREARQSRRDPTRWRHRQPPQSWRDRRRQVIRLAQRGEHRAPGVRRAA